MSGGKHGSSSDGEQWVKEQYEPCWQSADCADATGNKLLKVITAVREILELLIQTDGFFDIAKTFNCVINSMWPWSSHRQQCRYAVSCVTYGVWIFCCVTTAPQHPKPSVQFCVPFTGRVAGYATSRLLQRNTRRTSCVSAQSTSVGSQCRRQTDTSNFSVWVRHTNAARPTLAAVSEMHRFQVSRAHLSMPAQPGATVSFWLHPERRCF